MSDPIDPAPSTDDSAAGNNADFGDLPDDLPLTDDDALSSDDAPSTADSRDDVDGAFDGIDITQSDGPDLQAGDDLDTGAGR
ncbi:hypothetical protein CLV46_2247 [Diaminobutyricimonas aerilata]|uniref:Uncharacterized protein n=1 Tax=Diaminobutyricimonas aerilata TaxID=1162967 RepID=A0A2M9CLA7_9MICO|nr:hypothetical protein [Diaminobutyricimonas aerilata]PJJ72673.1 hypothetical protein CLV46_2247 [Diaminobutyricimonas aerilata]